jgi:hypothetical protein
MVGAMMISLLSFIREALKESIAIMNISISKFCCVIKARTAFYTISGRRLAFPSYCNKKSVKVQLK